MGIFMSAILVSRVFNGEPMFSTEIRGRSNDESKSGLPRASVRPAFAINGRFYGQPVTGVQRYAREIVNEIDQQLSLQDASGQLVIPPAVKALPCLKAIKATRATGSDGYLWEQVILPLRAKVPLLNLCNTAPLAVRRQIVCMHDTNVFDAPDSYSLAFRTVYRVLLPSLARRAAIITSVSRFSAHQLARHIGIDPDSVMVMHNGHEHVFRWNAAASTLAGRLSGLRSFVLLLGSKAQHKNAAFILRQASALDALGIDLVVAGGTAEIFAHTKTVEASNIHHLGFVTDDDLAWLYAHALCLAFPSRSEGFGLPLVEAMALGCPIVSSDQSCMPEICGDATLLANPQDAPAWQAHFSALLGSKDLQANLKARGLARSKLFSWRKSAQAYLELLARL